MPIPRAGPTLDLPQIALESLRISHRVGILRWLSRESPRISGGALEMCQPDLRRELRITEQLFFRDAGTVGIPVKLPR